ncbi:MAG: hypothetical protein K0Q91_1788 [Fibrobacteria bacterium]|jgi:hypothetical protein|nr:hypothetical protein [Fibrobacteria bacterium]
MTLAEDLRPRLLEYAAPFDNHPPEILDGFRKGVFPFEAGSDKGLGILLLFAALYRPGGESAASRLILALYGRFGNEIFKLNRIPFETLRDEVEAGGALADAAERARVPGILRSVCDFFYRVGPLKTWLEKAPDWETRVLELCGEIYWMGRHSVMKNKARYFLWLAAGAHGFPQARDFAWPVGEGHLRFYVDFLKPGRKRGGRIVAGTYGGTSSFDAEKRLRTFAELSRAVFPEEPWKSFTPLDAYLRRGGTLHYRCRTAQGGCRPCPLSAGCPAAPHFLAMEK